MIIVGAVAGAQEKAAGVVSGDLLQNRLPTRYSTRTRRSKPLTAIISRRYFRRYRDGRQIFEAGERPSGLGKALPSQRDWRAFLKTGNAQNAIRVARRFEEQLERIGGQSYARVAEHFGVSRATVCYHISLLRRLPQDFVRWLEAQTDPTLLRYFTEHRLRAVYHLATPQNQVSRLTEMIEEANALPKIITADDYSTDPA